MGLLSHWRSGVDFFTLSVALYILLRWAKQARALRFALAIAALHALALAARHLDLIITGWVLDGAAIVTALLLILVFQSELRRAFMRLDYVLRLWPRAGPALSEAHRVLSKAAFSLARSHVGALIVIVRRDSVEELVSSGVPLGAETSPGILEALFQKSSPLHDGAVLIEGDRIARANVVLPLTQREDIPEAYGTRHRAGMGLAERSDALVVVISEERGEVTLMEGRRLRPVANADELSQYLQKLETHGRPPLRARMRSILSAQRGIKVGAVALAAMIWGLSMLTSGVAIRTVRVPVEFDDVPSGLGVAQQSATELLVELRGRSWIVESFNPGTLVARFSLKYAREGLETLRVGPGVLNVPPGMRVEQVRPEWISVRLTRLGLP